MAKTPKIVTHRKRPVEQVALADFTFSDSDIPELTDERLRGYHLAAWETYTTLPFPTLRDEPWRRTDIRGLNTDQFQLAKFNQDLPQPPASLLNPITMGAERAGQVITGMSESQRWLDESVAAQGVVFMSFHEAEEQHPDLMDRLLSQIVSPAEDKFTALAAALAKDGVVLYVPKNVIVEKPLQSLYWGAGDHQAFFNHLIVWVEEGAQVTFVHESASPDGKPGTQNLHDGIVEIYVGRNARLNFVELQSWGITFGPSPENGRG